MTAPIDEESNLVVVATEEEEEDGIFVQGKHQQRHHNRRCTASHSVRAVLWKWRQAALVCLSLVLLLLVTLSYWRDALAIVPREGTPIEVPLLPPGDQTWSHATNTKDMLTEALRNPAITAIEMDLLLGYDTAVDPFHQHPKVPICSHPPEIDSDLSVAQVVHMMTNNNNDRRTLRKILKLDFKELEVVTPALDLFANTTSISNPDGNVIYLNADILPGPGHRKGANFDADDFVRACVNAMAHSQFPFAFSLGFRIESDAKTGYTDQDIAAMSDLIYKYNLMERSAGVVLAINARVLAIDMVPFDAFLVQFPTAQLLVWTGSGEDPIPKRLLDAIKDHFERKKTASRVGFDCKVGA